jgi:type I restriction enzyme M protein
VSDIIMGSSPPGESYNIKGSGIPFYQGKTEFGRIYIKPPVKWTSKPQVYADAEDILMSVRAPVGPVNIAKEKICIGRGLAAIKPNNEKILNKYVYYLLRNMEDSIKGDSGSTFPSINKKAIESIMIPLPPLDIQKEIVSEIESYQKIIDGASTVVENYKPLIPRDSGWPFVRIGEIVDFISGLTVSIPEVESENGMPIIAINNVTEEGHLTLKGLRKIKPPLNKKLNILKKGDLLFNWRNGSTRLVGKTAYFDLDGDYLFASFLLGIRAKTKLVSSPYLWHTLNSYRKDGKFLQLMRQNVNGLFNRDELKVTEIPLPPLEAQKAIVAEIEAEQALVNANRELIKHFEKKIGNTLNHVWGKEY